MSRLRSTGNHRRTQWTGRTVRRMMRLPKGLYRWGHRPHLHILIPGELGVASNCDGAIGWHRNEPYYMGAGRDAIKRHTNWAEDARVFDLINTVYGNSDQSGQQSPIPGDYESITIRNRRERWYIHVVFKNPNHMTECNSVADFINRVQSMTGHRALVYGYLTPICRWAGERHHKSQPEWVIDALKDRLYNRGEQ